MCYKLFSYSVLETLKKTKNRDKTMAVKILGILDLITAFSVLLLRLDLAPTLALVLGLYAVGKGIIFLRDISSIADIAAGGAIILAFYGYFNLLTWLAAIWLTQKGIVSIFS